MQENKPLSYYLNCFYHFLTGKTIVYSKNANEEERIKLVKTFFSTSNNNLNLFELIDENYLPSFASSMLHMFNENVDSEFHLFRIDEKKTIPFSINDYTSKMIKNLKEIKEEFIKLSSSINYVEKEKKKFILEDAIDLDKMLSIQLNVDEVSNINSIIRKQQETEIDRPLTSSELINKLSKQRESLERKYETVVNEQVTDRQNIPLDIVCKRAITWKNIWLSLVCLFQREKLVEYSKKLQENFFFLKTNAEKNLLYLCSRYNETVLIPFCKNLFFMIRNKFDVNFELTKEEVLLFTLNEINDYLKSNFDNQTAKKNLDYLSSLYNIELFKILDTIMIQKYSRSTVNHFAIFFYQKLKK